MSYGRIFPLWRAAAGPHWDAYVDHAFVRGIADGSLPRAAFLHYLVQDYLFLVQFARAWSLAVTKAETMEEMRHCAATAQALLEDELALHRGICAEAGIDARMLDAAEERPANIAYTRYVLDAGHAGDFAELLAALVPCVLGYGEIGRRLCTERRDTPYRDWIETYGGADYQALCDKVGALLDGAVTRRLGRVPQDAPRWPVLCGRFTTATRLEAGFWQMGLEP
ncbi:thiaminase II [Limimaricola hongkongensis]|uniref:Aminopyrimidine aminohydrolase n=1 Tax=Limimaricola hongkongensis DSM 17492 TaxID=1122180 RepID=A0A017H865_9RHOB|nr:thiaminase II [Limimaricola hongkongensis]EYD70495.1 Thiaminase II [Limimaricola hongkongensis DSM 17492]